MSNVLAGQDIEELRKHVGNLLEQECEGKGFTLVISDQYKHDDEWIYFIVTPEKGNIRAYDYATILSEVELKLRRDEQQKGVLLVPAMPD